MTKGKDHWFLLQRLDEEGRPFTPEAKDLGWPEGYPRGTKIKMNKWGYISNNQVWSTWGCQAHGGVKPCFECVEDWRHLLAQVKDGALKEWPEEAKFIPNDLKADFIRAFLEGKLKREG